MTTTQIGCQHRLLPSLPHMFFFIQLRHNSTHYNGAYYAYHRTKQTTHLDTSIRSDSKSHP